MIDGGFVRMALVGAVAWVVVGEDGKAGVKVVVQAVADETEVFGVAVTIE